jgi:hypothetical protein
MPIGNRSASPRRRVPDERTARSSTNQPGDVAPAPFTLDSRLDPGRARHGSCEYSYVQAASKELDVTFPSNEDLLPEIELQNCPSPPRNVCLDYWEPSPTTDLVLCSPAIELYYFGETICRHLFVCDADDNPMRSVTIAQVRQSALYNSLLKYLTMEYFNTSVTTNEAQRNLHTAKADTHFYLQQAWLDATSTEEVLLATMMFGLSASWDGNNQTGADYYRRSLSIYHGIIENENKPYPNRVFHEHALMYWWSGLSFVIKKTPGTLPDPPTSSSFSSDNPPIFVHPLVGISPRSHRLMGEVGALVYSQRSLALQHCFISMTSVREQEHMLHESQELEQALLAMHIPGPDDVVRKQSDDDTPAHSSVQKRGASRSIDVGCLVARRQWPSHILDGRHDPERLKICHGVDVPALSHYFAPLSLREHDPRMRNCDSGLTHLGVYPGRLPQHEYRGVPA